MKIDTSIIMLDLAGKPIRNEDKSSFTFGQALANILISCETGGKMKLFILGQKLYQEKDVSIDDSDLVLIKDAVKTTKVANALVAGQCELLLESIKKEE